jgi:hypothetical protein
LPRVRIFPHLKSLECDLKKAQYEKKERWQCAHGEEKKREKWKSHLLFLNKKWHECEITLEEISVNKFHSEICSLSCA